MENFDKFFDQSELNYSPAFVYRKRDFFSIMFHWRPDFSKPMQRYRKTFNLNRIKDLQARARAADVMATTITQALKNGWNPTTGTIKGVKPKEFMLLSDAIRKAHDSIILKSKGRTPSSYNSHNKALIAYLESIRKYHIPPGEFEAMDAQEYQDYLISEGYAPKTANNKTDYASGLFEWMVDKEIITKSPFARLKPLREPESEVHELFTYEEIERIKTQLLKHCPELWQFVLFIYYCYMRPDSIVNISRSSIDINNNLMILPGEHHKNSKTVYKEIVPVHAKYLYPYIEDLPPDFLLFSNGKALTPGTKKNYPTRASELWKTLIKEGLGINKNMYGLKATGSAHFLELNNGKEPLKWLQMQLSHSDLQTTSIYTNKLKIVRLDKNAVIPEI